MEGEINNFYKKHKNVIITIGTGIVVVGGMILIGKNWSTITDNFSETVKHGAEVKDRIIAAVEQPAIGLIKNHARAIPDVKQALTISAAIQEAPIGENIIGVRPHIRNLSVGYHISPMKVRTAMNNGFILNQGQTWVGAYSRAIT